VQGGTIVKAVNCFGLALALFFLVAVDPAAHAAPPTTLWNFLGIPQGIQKVRDARLNRRGNRPQRERKPPLKRIADPENLESDNQAIKTAAKIKQDQDLKKQKIKAIKYLATVGCGCYPDVRETLLSALEDCDPDVRMEAAIAFCVAAGNFCDPCEQNGCCNAAVMSKLNELAYEQDEEGCFKEPDPRVRKAAENALNACKMMVPPAPGKPPAPDGEGPIEAPPEQPESPFEEESATSGIVNPVSFVGLSRAHGAKTTDSAVSACFAQCAAGSCRGDCVPCLPGEGVAPGEPAVPSELEGAVDEALPEGPAAPSLESFASSFGAAPGPQSIAPNMLGDSLSPRARLRGDEYSQMSGCTDVSIAGGDRTFKIAENSSPIPTDRVFFNYNHFHRALIAGNGLTRSLDRYTFGIEKTYCCGLGSVELRIPFAHGLNSRQSSGLYGPLAATEFGNLAVAWKHALCRDSYTTLSAGLGMTFPTGDEALAVEGRAGRVMTRIKNNAVHLQPFLGWLRTPNQRVFYEAFVQLDFDCNGNTVYTSSYAGPPIRRGTLFDQILLYVDFTAGFWAYHNENASLLWGVAPMLELHYTSTLQGAANVGGITNPCNRMDILNITGGLHFQLGPLSTLRVAAVAPLTSGDDTLFPAEVTVQFNRRY